MENKKKIILSSLGLLLLAGSLVAAIFTIGKQTVFKNKAFNDTGTASFTVSPSSATKNVGDVFPVNFQFDTVGAPNGVSMIQFDFSLPSNLDLVNSSGSPVNQLTVAPAFAAAGTKWTFSFNSVTRNAGTVSVKFSGTYNDTTGYTTATPVTIATVYLKAISAGTANFTFDRDNSLILTKSFPVADIMKTPAPISFTISSGTTPGVGKLLFVPAVTTLNPGQTTTTQVKINTGGTAVSSLSFRLSYPYTGTTPELDAIDITPNNPSTSPDDWAFPVKTITRSGGVVTIDFAAINSNVAGFTSSTDVILATINFKANSIPTTNPVIISFDATKTSILSKASPPVEILQMPTSLSYTIAAAPECTTDSGCPDAKKCVSNACVAVICPTAAPECKSNIIANHACTVQNAANGTVCGTAGSTCQNGVCTAPAIPTLSLGFKVSGVSTAGVTKAFTVTVKGAPSTSIYTVSLTSAAGGVFKTTTPITLTGVTVPAAGTTFDILVKAPNTLKKKLGSINLIPGVNTGPVAWENVTAMPGDFDNNNIFNIQDVAKMLQNYTALSTPVTAANGLGLYDVDNDGNYALKDIAAVLSNFTDLTKPGD